jgi:3'-phosphoadenosine 5'-phosphosulfate (PAPS) 3'-phosphatase
MELVELSKQAVQAALEAGRVIRSYRERDVEVEYKDGGHTAASQVVTEVDRKAQDAILRLLEPASQKLDIAVLTEEREDDRSRLEKDYFWCIDPMDGTLSFITGEEGYSVSIALVARAGSPQLGVVYDPVRDVLYEAIRDQGLKRNGSSWNPEPGGSELTFTYDRSFVDRPEFDEVVERLETHARSIGLQRLNATQYGGAVMNACHVLERAPGCHFKFPKPREGGGCLWDYAATACLFREAGAVVSDASGDPLDLNRADSTFMNHRGVVYATDATLAAKVREIMAECRDDSIL